MSNTIATRIYDFIKEFPPFSLMDRERLEQVARSVVVQYRKPGELIFRQGEKPGTCFYFVREGAVQLVHEEEEGRVLVDQCDEGDLFGLRPFLADDVYVVTAEVVEETLLYAMEIAGFQPVLEENPRVAAYLASSFAASWRNNINLHEPAARDHTGLVAPAGAAFGLVEIQSLDHSKEPVVCLPQTPVREAALIMSREEVGSIIAVDEHKRPLGIVTDKDLRHKVATGLVGLETPVSAIMSSPVVTMPPSVTVADVQMEMLRRRIHHLCLTEDGTDGSAVVGVISEHDILVVQANNPAILIRELGRSRKASDLRRIRDRAEDLLKKYIYQEVSISYISTVITEINDALIVRAVELAMEDLAQEGWPEPGVSFCWLALGSEGRGEQLLRTDQDNALIFEDVPAESAEAVKGYFLELARQVTATLRECGFEYCPAGMMASNPRWCLSLSEWQQQFAEWITRPTPEAVMHSTIFFDYRPVYGEEALPEQLTDFIFMTLDGQEVFLSFLAKNALENPPPLTFFRNFVVEKGGEHKDAFDIKARAMMPLADAARLLVLASRISRINNTFRRFERLAALEPQNRELYEQAAEAYEILMRYRTMQGLRNGDPGRYFKPLELTKMERLNLRNSFRPIGELQSLVSTRFQTAFIR